MTSPTSSSSPSGNTYRPKKLQGLIFDPPCSPSPRLALAKSLDVGALEPGALHREHDVADVEQFAVGEHVPAKEAPRPDLRSPLLAESAPRAREEPRRRGTRARRVASRT